MCRSWYIKYILLILALRKSVSDVLKPVTSRIFRDQWPSKPNLTGFRIHIYQGCITLYNIAMIKYASEKPFSANGRRPSRAFSSVTNLKLTFFFFFFELFRLYSKGAIYYSIMGIMHARWGFRSYRTAVRARAVANEFSGKLNWKRSLGGRAARGHTRSPRRTSRPRKTNNCRVRWTHTRSPSSAICQVGRSRSVVVVIGLCRKKFAVRDCMCIRYFLYPVYTVNLLLSA